MSRCIPRVSRLLRIPRVLLPGITVLLLPGAALAVPQGTTFTYQGELTSSGVPMAGNGDFRFTLHDADAGGATIGGMVALDDVPVPNGRFAAELDFGAVFDGDARWLEIQVRFPHDPTDTQPFVTLAPRQPVTAAPYALHALDAGWERSGSALVNTNPGFVGINRDYTVGLEWFGVHAPVASGYGGMYVTTEGAAGWPFYGYRAGTSLAWTYLNGATGDWHVNVDGNRLTVADSTGHVGIGTILPTERLHVAGTVYSSTGGFKFPDGTVQSTAAGPAGSGNTLDAAYDQGGAGAGRTITADAGAVQILGTGGLTIEAANSGAALAVDQTADGLTAQFFDGGTPTVTIDATGRLGVGTTVPASELDVRAQENYGAAINLERTSAAANANDIVQIRSAAGSDPNAQLIEAELGTDPKFRVWMDGDVTADGTLAGGGADFAEAVRVARGAASVEAGDVMVIDPASVRGFAKSAAARSPLVAGVYSTKPGVLASEHDWDQVALDLGMVPRVADGEEAAAVKPLEVARRLDEVPLAVVGIVPCKVSAENGPIRAGDLLVTAATPGHAMRDENARAGTIVGKALGSLASGTGVIPVLVTLQ